MLYHGSARTEYVLDVAQLVATLGVAVYTKRTRWIEALTVHMVLLGWMFLDYAQRMHSPDVMPASFRVPAMGLVWATAVVVLLVFAVTPGGAWETASGDVLVAIVTGRLLAMDMVRLWYASQGAYSAVMYARVFAWVFCFSITYIALTWSLELLVGCYVYQQFALTATVSAAVLALSGGVLSFLAARSLMKHPRQELPDADVEAPTPLITRTEPLREDTSSDYDVSSDDILHGQQSTMELVFGF